MTYVLPQASPLFGDQLILQFLFHHPRNDANAEWTFKKPIRLISDSCKDSRDLYRWIYLLVQIERRGGSTLEIPSSSATRLLILDDHRRLEESLKNWEALRKASTVEINHHYWLISIVDYSIMAIYVFLFSTGSFFHSKDLKGPLFRNQCFLILISILLKHLFRTETASSWPPFFAQKASAWSNFMCSKPWCVARRDPRRRRWWKCGEAPVGFGWCWICWMTYPIRRHFWVDDIPFLKGKCYENVSFLEGIRDTLRFLGILAKGQSLLVIWHKSALFGCLGW